MNPKKQPPGDFLFEPEQVNCSWEAWYAASEYWQRHNRVSTDTRPECAKDTGRLLRTYGADRVNDLIYDAAMLSDIAGGIFKNESINMPTVIERDALEIFFSGRDLESLDSRYIMAFLADWVKIEMFRQEQTKGLYTDHDEINQILNRPMSGEVLVDHPEVWDMPVQIVDVNKMFDLADVINLETMLARSAGNLAWLRRFGSNGQRINKSASVLRKVAETESMLAPLMEIIGFHKMAMALNDVNMQIRLYNSGNGYVVEAAREIVGQLPSGEALSLEAENIIRDLFGDNLHEEVTKNDDSGLFMREGFIEPDIDPDVMKHAILRLIIRRKTDGAIARKLREYDLMGKEGTPMDILGATILAESEEQIPALFSRALESVKENPAYKPQPSPSRDYPVHVQGPAEFLNRLPLESIKAINGRDWQLPEPSDGFQVAKVTFLHGATPCEVQIITKAGRVENNLGERTSHISHEARKAAKARIVRQGGIIVPGLAYVDTTGWEEKLHRINARRNYMSGVVINKQSEAGADVIARGLAPNRRGMGGVIKQLQNL